VTPTAEPTAPPLAAGTYTSAVFTPHLTFTVSDGWVLDEAAYWLQLNPPGHPQHRISVLNVYPRCIGHTDAGVNWDGPHAGRDFVECFESQTHCTKTSVTVGGLDGWRFDSLPGHECRAGYFLRISNTPFTTSVTLGNGEPGFYVLDDGNDGALLIRLDFPEPPVAKDPDFLVNAESLIGSFVFHDGPVPCPTPTSSGTATPAITGKGIALEFAHWQDESGQYRYVVLATNKQSVSTARVELTFVDGCGKVETESRNLGQMAR